MLAGVYAGLCEHQAALGEVETLSVHSKEHGEASKG